MARKSSRRGAKVWKIGCAEAQSRRCGGTEARSRDAENMKRLEGENDWMCRDNLVLMRVSTEAQMFQIVVYFFGGTHTGSMFVTISVPIGQLSTLH